MSVGYGFRPICDLPPLSESLRDSESHLNVHSRGHAGPHGVWGIIFIGCATDGGLINSFIYSDLLSTLVHIET